MKTVYTFKCRDTDRLFRQEADSRFSAQCLLPIGFWQCLFVETDSSVDLYDEAIHR